MLNREEEENSSLGRDFISMVVDVAPKAADDAIDLLLDHYAGDEVSQNYLVVLRHCLDQVMRGSFNGKLNSAMARLVAAKSVKDQPGAGSPPPAESTALKFQLGDHILFEQRSQTWLPGSVVGINHVKGVVSIEFEDFDAQGAPVMKQETIDLSMAASRIRQENARESSQPMVNQDSIRDTSAGVRMTVLDLMQNNDYFAKILSLSYLQVHGKQDLPSLQQKTALPTCACEKPVRIPIVASKKKFSCPECDRQSAPSRSPIYFGHCPACGYKCCCDCLAQRHREELNVTLCSQEKCLVYEKPSKDSEIVSVVAPFSTVKVVNVPTNAFFELQQGEMEGFVMKYAPSASLYWKSIPGRDLLADANHAGYLGTLIKHLLRIDRLRKQLVTPSDPAQQSLNLTALHQSHEEVLRAAAHLFKTVSIINAPFFPGELRLWQCSK